MGHKEQRVFRYIWIPLSMVIIGLLLYLLIGRIAVNNIATELAYIKVQGQPADKSEAVPDNNAGEEVKGIEYSGMSEGVIDESEWIMPLTGEQYGVIRFEGVADTVPLYYGDTKKILDAGAGHSPLSGFPGQQKKILIGGHDTTFFAPLQNVNIEDIITLECTYGTFKYKVSSIDIMEGSDYSLSDDEESEDDDSSDEKTEEGEQVQKEQLILYTCYPFGKVTNDRNRKIVYTCDLVSGPVIGGSEVE